MSVPPDSVVVKAEAGVMVIPAKSLSTFITVTSGGFTPEKFTSALMAAAV